jgi:hypothetical protein
MKNLLILLSIAIVSGCSSRAPVVQLTLGVPKRHKAGSRLVEFPARLTNISKRPVWFYGAMPQWPYYSAFTRKSKSDPWEDLSYSMCAVGASEYELAPNASMRFTTVAPADDAGCEYRVELSIYKSPGGQTKSVSVTSAPVTIP